MINRQVVEVKLKTFATCTVKEYNVISLLLLVLVPTAGTQLAQPNKDDHILTAGVTKYLQILTQLLLPLFKDIN